MYQKYLKRYFDLVFASIGFLFLSPVFVLISFILLIANRGSAFYMQSRLGKRHRVFQIIKFKTMNDGKDESGILLSDEQRLTFIGRIVRATSLDEIPQLLNVIKGDMSLVGPRPLLLEYLPLYNEEQKRRHHVFPGITGWAQINGRNASSWEERFQHDLWYVQNVSFWLDLRILLLTILKVLKSEGISAEGVATMPKFRGNSKMEPSLHRICVPEGTSKSQEIGH